VPSVLYGGSENFERRYYSEDAIVVTATRYAVEMRACEPAGD
jgi:hypothetical protein